MKRRVFSIALAGFALTLLASATAFAQLPGEPIRANIPFDFTVRGKTLPAGEYEIKRVTDELGTLEIANVNHSHKHAMFETDPVESARVPRHGEVVFHRYGESYFLYEIWSPGLQTGHAVPVSHQERILQREAAMYGTNSQAETVALAAE
jgi:hypothetical protein